jgi:hypothetical protein
MKIPKNATHTDDNGNYYINASQTGKLYQPYSKKTGKLLQRFVVSKDIRPITKGD